MCVCNCYYSVHRSESLKHTPADNDSDPSHCGQECACCTHTRFYQDQTPQCTHLHVCTHGGCARESQAELEKMISCCDLRWPFTHTLILVCSLCNPLHPHPHVCECSGRVCVGPCARPTTTTDDSVQKSSMHVHYIMVSFVLTFFAYSLVELVRFIRGVQTCVHAHSRPIAKDKVIYVRPLSRRACATCERAKKCVLDEKWTSNC